MGPDTRWSGIDLVLRLDARGRYLATWNPRPLQMQFGPVSIEIDNWGEEERKQFVDRVLWDATTAMPRCLNDDGFPSGSFCFDPTGRRILNYGHTIYDAETRAPLSSQDIRMNWGDAPIFSADDRWVAVPEQTESWQPAWLPNRVANLIDQFLHPTNAPIRIIRLSDGKTVRQLYGRTSPTLTADGHLWTVTKADRTDDTVTLVAERWSPEPPWPPWCLVLLIFAGVSGLVWDLRRARRTVRRSTI